MLSKEQLAVIAKRQQEYVDEMAAATKPKDKHANLALSIALVATRYDIPSLLAHIDAQADLLRRAMTEIYIVTGCDPDACASCSLRKCSARALYGELAAALGDAEGQAIEHVREETEPADPWAGYDQVFRLFSLAHDWKTPKEAKANANGTSFLTWLSERREEWWLATDYKHGASWPAMSAADHAAFDVWLRAKVEGQQ